MEFANEVMDRKGVLFIPSFSVERSQEIACVLRAANFKHRIIMDGMALKVNDIIFRHPEYLRDPDVFKSAIKDSVAIRDHAHRKRALRDAKAADGSYAEPCVVISPAGMLVGGNAVFYLQELAFEKRNGIALVSYQGDGTPGRMLLDTGKVEARGKEIKVEAEVRKFEFLRARGQERALCHAKEDRGKPQGAYGARGRRVLHRVCAGDPR